MNFFDDIRKVRIESLLSQEAFAKEIGVSFVTINRRETGKTRPSYQTIKTICEFCQSHNIEFDENKYLQSEEKTNESGEK
ncbi:MAG: helix-turn-helix transcriptional regulator [Syntrophomonadaceae bacterium]|jgi:putative transcriptional regulator|nr:helix-turn-helix transcriptional regulator [Syntrophomonadaceae bacterium]